MRTLITCGLLILIALAAGPGASLRVTAQDQNVEPVNLVLDMSSSGEVFFNRLEWGALDYAVLLPATGVRPNDYIETSADPTIVILCADLKLVKQRGSGVAECTQYPPNPAFLFADDPLWMPSEGPVTVVVTDETIAPAEISDPGAYARAALEGDALALVQDGIAQIDALPPGDVSDDAKAFALSNLYRTYGMTFDAINALLALPDMDCRTRPSVNVPAGEERTLMKSPAVYLRLGELYQMLGQNTAADRYYGCATQLAQQLQDPANTALAAARQANVADITASIAYYQTAINNYAAINALDYANALLEFCGGRNCSMP